MAVAKLELIELDCSGNHAKTKELHEKAFVLTFCLTSVIATTDKQGVF